MPKYEIVQGRVCGTCQHFRRHYVQWNASAYFYALNDDGCVYPRLKKRTSEQTCAHYAPKEAWF